MKSDIREMWDIDLTDDELSAGRKDLNKMIEIIQSNTGHPRKEIRNKLLVIV